MIRDWIFEMQCADEIGYHKMADQLNSSFIKIASSDPKKILQKLYNKYGNIESIKNIEFSKYKKKFIVTTDGELLNKDKNSIKSEVVPFSVSFQYISKII
jgi:hypothetical protein